MPLKLKNSNKKEHPKTALWYTLYTRSERWAEIRERLFKQRGKKCEICKSTKNIIAHHLTYEHVTHERLSELKVLCQTCHSNLPHDSYHVPFIFVIYDDTYINLKRVNWVKIHC